MIKCEICKKEYNTYSALGTHLSRVHNIKDTEEYYRRIHRYSLRKQNEPKHISEFQLRKSEGYDWIWDCGNYKFRFFKEDKI